LLHDADELPEESIRPILVEVLRLAPTGETTFVEGLWPVFEEYLIRGLTQVEPDRRDPEFKALVSQFRRFTALCLTPQERLRQMLREARCTAVWEQGTWGFGSTALDHGHTLLGMMAPDERDPDLVIGLLRLAQELGQQKWLALHAEPLLLTLHPTDLRRMRPSDTDLLRPVVKASELLQVFEQIDSVWRTHAPSQKNAPDRRRS
jgi:hypothetical protein